MGRPVAPRLRSIHAERRRPAPGRRTPARRPRPERSRRTGVHGRGRGRDASRSSSSSVDPAGLVRSAADPRCSCPPAGSPTNRPSTRRSATGTGRSSTRSGRSVGRTRRTTSSRPRRPASRAAVRSGRSSSSTSNRSPAPPRTRSVELSVISAYRSYDAQVRTFASLERAYGRAFALESAARPGHSEHQLGTAIDIDGGGTWLARTRLEHGFVVSYPAERSPAFTCYKPEPWHIRYVGRARAAAIQASGLSPREWLWAHADDDR